ncbi:MAG: hypothetical protein GC136_07200 [Alphaproteobacteria bacterium]|nr:hypothetical protein [Alphaproteobacteria bacterium]
MSMTVVAIFAGAAGGAGVAGFASWYKNALDKASGFPRSFSRAAVAKLVVVSAIFGAAGGAGGAYIGERNTERVCVEYAPGDLRCWDQSNEPPPYARQ